MFLWCAYKRNSSVEKKIIYEGNLLEICIIWFAYQFDVCLCVSIVIEFRCEILDLKIKFIFIELIKKHFTVEFCIYFLLWMKYAWFDQCINIWSVFHWNIIRIDLENIYFDRIDDVKTVYHWYSKCLVIFIFFLFSNTHPYHERNHKVQWFDDKKQSKHNSKQTKFFLQQSKMILRLGEELACGWMSNETNKWVNISRNRLNAHTMKVTIEKQWYANHQNG